MNIAGGCGLDSSCYGREQGPVAGSLKHGNKPSGSIKDGEFSDYVRAY
jgi:hypothetical protein